MSARIRLVLDPDLAAPVAWAFRRQGFDVEVATDDAAEGLVDVVFVQDGDRDRTLQRGSARRCVLVTSRQENVERLAATSDGVVLMPFRPSELVECARSLLSEPAAVPCCAG